MPVYFAAVAKVLRITSFGLKYLGLSILRDIL